MILKKADFYTLTKLKNVAGGGSNIYFLINKQSQYYMFFFIKIYNH